MIVSRATVQEHVNVAIELGMSEHEAVETVAHALGLAVEAVIEAMQKPEEVSA